MGLCLASVLSAAILAGRCLWVHFITSEREAANSFGKCNLYGSAGFGRSNHIMAWFLNECK